MIDTDKNHAPQTTLKKPDKHGCKERQFLDSLSDQHLHLSHIARSHEQVALTTRHHRVPLSPQVQRRI